MIEGLVSTVIPVHNRARFLREAVASVLAQTWRSSEIVIVDDGSTDDTLQAARELEKQHPGVVFVVSQANAGPGAARQNGLERTRGEFVQFLDSDDLLLPAKFELQVAALRADPEAGICYGRTWFNDNGRRAAQPAQRTGEVHRQIFPALLEGRLWETSTPLYRRSAIECIGPWPATWQMEDWRYDAQAGAAGVALVHCGEYVAEYRVHGEARLAHAWMSDPEAMADRVHAFLEIARCARAAGMTDNASAMQHFARTLFAQARFTGAAGYADDAHRLMSLALRLSGPLARKAEVWLYDLLTRVVGWSAMEHLTRLRDARNRPSTSS